MPVWVVTGKMGSGKTLVSVGKIRDRLLAGHPVATNLNLDLTKLVGKRSRRAHDCRVMRLPDKPSPVDFHAIGSGNDSGDEENNGLIVLDECGTWFNSRSWGDKQRQDIIDFFVHTRKLGWDIIFLIQDLSMMDKQARVGLAEYVVYCRRLDRLPIPLIGRLLSLKMPRLHIGIVKYGDTANALIADRWIYRGNGLFPAYDTRQKFSSDYPHGVYTLLPPWITHGLFMVPRDGDFYMRITKIYWRRFNRPLLASVALLVGVLATIAATGTVNTVKIDHAPLADTIGNDPFTGLYGSHIVGYFQFGQDFNYEILTTDQNRIPSDKLILQGFELKPNGRCSLFLNHGENHRAEITC